MDGVKMTGGSSGITIRQGNTVYIVEARDHSHNLRVNRRLPGALEKIRKLSRAFVGKPQFIIGQDGPLVTVMREDFISELQPLIQHPQESFERRLTESEWRVDTVFRGYEEAADKPITLHDVFLDGNVTIKTGNPYRNNAWQEFFRALHARSLGIVEAKSALGFSFYRDDLYGVERPGRMFYKHLVGKDIQEALVSETPQVLNWALWETAKFFSRLMYARLYLEDSDRLGNLFIEASTGAARIFRFLDLECLSFSVVYSRQMKAEMLAKFMSKAIQQGLLTEERLGEFLIVSLGANADSIAPLVIERLNGNGTV